MKQKHVKNERCQHCRNNPDAVEPFVAMQDVISRGSPLSSCELCEILESFVQGFSFLGDSRT